MGLMDRLRSRKPETVNVELRPWRLMPGTRVRVEDIDHGVLDKWMVDAEPQGSGRIGDVQLALVDGVPTVYAGGERLGVMSETFAHYYVEPLRVLLQSGYYGLVGMWVGGEQPVLEVMRGKSPLLIPANQPPDGVPLVEGDEWEVVREDAALLKPWAVKDGERSAWFLIRRQGDGVMAAMLNGRPVGSLSKEATPHALHALGSLDVACIAGAITWYGATPQLTLG